MNEKETGVMLHFISRMGMFIQPINRDTIISFIHGLDVGRGSQLNWTDLLKAFMTDTYNISTGSLGWTYQIDKYCEINRTTWSESFKKLMTELIESSEEIKWSNELEKNHIKLMNKGTL